MMNDAKENPGYYAVIPAKVRYDKALSPSAKLLYGEITALCNQEGYCWASNSYFAELYNVNRSSITHWIKQLVQAGHIRQELVYAEDKPMIKERKIYITNQVPFLSKKQMQSDEAENKGNKGGGEIFDQGGEIIHQGGGEIFNQGGEKTQERILHSNITNSAAADPPKDEKPPPKAAAEGFQQNPEELSPDALQAAAGPPREEIAELKRRMKELDPGFIFDEMFYRRALGFMACHHLDSGYISWMYEFCTRRKPYNISGFYFKVFFEKRFIELYREYLQQPSRPPPVTTMPCPVCEVVHDTADQSCPRCGLKAADRNDRQCVEREKQLYALPPDTRAAYETDLKQLFQLDEGLPRNFEEKTRLLKSLEDKYGLKEQWE